MRDFQRSKIYSSERLAMSHCYPVKQLTLPECRELIQKAAKFTNGPIPMLKDGRGTRAARGSCRTINLPKWARTNWIVLHEYTHAITEDKHCPNFARQYLKLVKRFIGKTESDILRLSFKQYKVKYRQSTI